MTFALCIDCLQSVSLSFLYRNNTRKEHAGHEIRTRTARRIGTRRDGLSCLTATFCEPACLGLITRRTSREKEDFKHSTLCTTRGVMKALDDDQNGASVTLKDLTPSSICVILHIIRKPNSFIQNISRALRKTKFT